MLWRSRRGSERHQEVLSAVLVVIADPVPTDARRRDSRAGMGGCLRTPFRIGTLLPTIARLATPAGYEI